CQQHAFCERLPQQTPATRTKRSANSKLSTPAAGTRQYQVADIDAGYQQHESNCAKQRQKDWLNVANDSFLQRDKLCEISFVGLRISFGKVGHHSVEISFSLPK